MKDGFVFDKNNQVVNINEDTLNDVKEIGNLLTFMCNVCYF